MSLPKVLVFFCLFTCIIGESATKGVFILSCSEELLAKSLAFGYRFYSISNRNNNVKIVKFGFVFFSISVSVSVFPHCSIARKLLPLHPCIKKCTIMDAKKDYSHVISGYRNELRLNGKATLSAYCRSVGVSISAVHHWMENYGITTKKIKAEMAELAGSDSPFVPLSSEMPVPVRSSGRIELTFPNGVLLSADQYPPQDLLVLLNGYRGGRV